MSPPPEHREDAVRSILELTLALWEIIVTRAQPLDIVELNLCEETELNRRWREWEQEQERLGLLPPQGHYIYDKEPPSAEMRGFRLRPKLFPTYRLRVRSPSPDTLNRIHHYGAGYPIPSDIPPQLRRAILMLNHCDSGNFAMKALLTKLLHNIHPDIRVDWLLVVPASRFEIQLEGCQVAFRHSVLLIITPWASQIVLDLTGEQTGVEGQDRISSLHKYLRDYVASSKEWSAVRYTCNSGAHVGRVQDIFESLVEEGSRFWFDIPVVLDSVYRKWQELHGGHFSVEELCSVETREWMEAKLAGDMEQLRLP